MTEPKCCLLISYAGSHNLGDDLMLLGAIEYLDHYSRVLVTSKHCSQQFLKESRAEFVGMQLRSIVTALTRSEAVLMCGGTWFHDSVSRAECRRLQLALLKIVAALGLSRILGKKLRLLRIGVGPIRSRLTKWIAVAGLRLAHEITVRDATSQEWLRQLGIGEVPIETDFGADYLDRHRLAARPTETIVISPVMSDLFESAEEAAEFWLDLAQSTQQQAKGVCQGAEVVILPFCYSDGIGGDAEMLDVMRGRLSDKLRFIDWRNQVSSLQELISVCQGSLFLAGRYHSLVFAASCASTTVALAYHEKCESFAHEAGLKHIIPRARWRVAECSSVVERAIQEHFRRVARSA